MVSSKFVDANVFLDVYLERAGHLKAQAVLSDAKPVVFSALTGHLVFHFLKGIYARADIAEFIQPYVMTPLIREDFEWAYTHGDMYEFEDALQVAVAIRSGCQEFITFDKKLIKKINTQDFIKARLP